MKVKLISVPYDAGRFMAGLGLGPLAILEAGLAAKLTAAGHDVTETTLLLGESRPREISTGFAMAADVARACREAALAEQFPLVIAGNCLTALGICAGTGADAALWFDAHGDLNTPDTTTSGLLDGMALSALMGRCWPGLTGSIEGFAALPPQRVVIVDGRDLDPPEAAVIAQEQIRHIAVAEASAAATDLAGDGARHIYLHLDLDVHDPAQALANQFGVSGGPSPEEVRQAVTRIATAAPLAGAAMTAYDPSFDPSGRTAAAAVDLAAALINAVAERRASEALNSAVRL